MKLHKVEIIGFKSFGDKTVLEFHEGITCIVGPNGCGKSNIGDAIRWVLGEQSAKALRGGKMPDVIFGGTSTRKPLNYAEVTITFTEVAGALPIGYDEVAITRRISRNGDSEYFINRHLARLKDVHSLFLDSGIGKNNFSIFEQGKIDQIIQYSPLERRYIFEEASGIVRFLQRKRETLRKLEDAELNIARVQDIHQEIKKQIGTLEEQASFATIYQKNKERLSHLEKSVLLNRLSSYEKKHADLIEKEGEAKAKQKALNVEKALLEESMEAKKRALDELEASYLSSRDQFFAKRSDKELKAQSHQHVLKLKKDLSDAIRKAELEIKLIQELQEEYVKECALLKKSKEALKLELNEAETKRRTADSAVQTLEKELQKTRASQVDSHHERVRSLQKQSALDSSTKQIKIRLESYIEKKGHLDARKLNLSPLLEEKRVEVQKKKEAYVASLDEMKERESALISIDLELKESVKKIASLESEIELLRKNEHKLSARHQALIHLKQEFSGFTSGAKKLLQASSDPKNPLFGKISGLYEKIVPALGFEESLSLALKTYSQTLIVESQDDLHLTLQYANEHKIHDFSIFCLEQVKHFSDVLGPFFKNVIPNEYSAHFLGNIGLKDNAEVFSKDGFIDSKGVLFIGGALEQSVFGREAEMKSLELEIAHLLEEKEKKSNLLQKDILKKTEIQNAKALADEQVRKGGMKSVEANFHLQKVEGELSRSQHELKDVEEAIKSTLETIKSLVSEQELAESASKEALKAADLIHNKSLELEALQKEKELVLDQKKSVLKEAEKNYLLIEEQFRKCSHSLNVQDVKLQESRRNLERLEGDLKANLTRLQELESKNNDIDLLALEQGLNEAEKKTAALENELKQAKLEEKNLEEKKKKIEIPLRELEGKIHQIAISLASVETGQNTTLLEYQERFNESIDDVSSIPKLEEGAEKEIKTLKEFFEKNQNVNLAAIDDCKASHERADFLEKQMLDLRGSKEELLTMINDLDSESRLLFKSTFDQIRANFKKNFQILFKGGEADLELLESPDVLEAGIEITAKPPGKQMRSLSLLSGGEKCLTAMALLFAIFEVKSSPFCILDEIDAPLDDSNVERFLSVVKQFIDKCQFIIVTHNKQTMALADRLYGVSMQEKGVSKLLTMEFAKALI